VRETCTLAAADLQAREGDCAVVTSYSVPLLVGCGTVRKGALRAIGKPASVPVIGAYARRGLAPHLVARLREALLSVGRDPALRRALETRDGFVAP